MERDKWLQFKLHFITIIVEQIYKAEKVSREYMHWIVIEIGWSEMALLRRYLRWVLKDAWKYAHRTFQGLEITIAHIQQYIGSVKWTTKKLAKWTEWGDMKVKKKGNENPMDRVCSYNRSLPFCLGFFVCLF